MLSSRKTEPKIGDLNEAQNAYWDVTYVQNPDGTIRKVGYWRCVSDDEYPESDYGYDDDDSKNYDSDEFIESDVECDDSTQEDTGDAYMSALYTFSNINPTFIPPERKYMKKVIPFVKPDGVSSWLFSKFEATYLMFPAYAHPWINAWLVMKLMIDIHGDLFDESKRDTEMCHFYGWKHEHKVYFLAIVENLLSAMYPRYHRQLVQPIHKRGNIKCRVQRLWSFMLWLSANTTPDPREF